MTPTSTPGPAPDAVRLRAEAVALVDAGRCEDAAAILARLLAGLDPGTCAATVDVVDTAILYAAVVQHKPWATYAYHAADTLCGPDHERTIKAADVLGQLHRIACEYPRAVPLFRHVHQARAAHHGPAAPRTVYAALWLAWCLHHAGECDEALTELDRLYTALSTRNGTADRQARRILSYRDVLLHNCGRLGEAPRSEVTINVDLPLGAPEPDPLQDAFAQLWQQHTDEPHALVCAHQQLAPVRGHIPATPRPAGHVHRRAAPPGRPPTADRGPGPAHTRPSSRRDSDSPGGPPE